MLAVTSSWRRPWCELIKPIWLFSRPKTFGSAMRRIKSNVAYFHVNYTIVVHATLFLRVWLHQYAIFFYMHCMLVSFLFYFLEVDELEFEVWNHPIDGRLLFEVLLTFPVLALLFAGLWLKLLVSFLVSFGLLGLHATFRGLLFEDLENLEPTIALVAAAA